VVFVVIQTVKSSNYFTSYADNRPQREAEGGDRTQRRHSEAKNSPVWRLSRAKGRELSRTGGNVLLLACRLRLHFGPAVGDDALANVLAVQGEDQPKTTCAISGVRDAERHLITNQLGTKEFTALEVPWLDVWMGVIKEAGERG